MRNDERFEIQRAFDLLPHVVGASWAAVWFRMKGIKKPTKEEFREKTLEYIKMVEPVFKSYPNEEAFLEIRKYIEFRKNEEYEKIRSGENKEIEIRYKRYVDYG
ncbi:MAG: hypothetical protein OEL56_06265 [Nitrosopumilus sp.]|nr:hypothetical protein [Nitrosopumilus sp.]MDH3516109.1 hypothetical protein [Nitrosopumilus sp.]MDH3564596.1 hypothetical protein [Nitrosopumilus sp.]MDH5416817.1 hypothetical protein [Nitrosopumilus sp.]MDH5554661.1 hypothetical protein [Nitrosopumilus sp.]